MNTTPVPGDNAITVLGRSLTLGFKFLVWLNGLGLLLVFSCSIGVIEIGLPTMWLRFPLVSFLGGMALAGLGLMWSYSVQVSLIHQAMIGTLRRTHWVPLACTTIAYMLSLFGFLAGCWFFQLLMESAY